MNAVPVVLDVAGDFFKPSHKYTSSAAMVLDSAEGWDDETGEVDWVYNVRAFYSLDINDTFSMVANYIEGEQDSSPTWADARQMIDILAEGSNWLLYTNSQGFVSATCFDSLAAAKDAFRIDNEAYSNWLNSEDE